MFGHLIAAIVIGIIGTMLVLLAVHAVRGRDTATTARR